MIENASENLVTLFLHAGIGQFIWGFNTAHVDSHLDEEVAVNTFGGAPRVADNPVPGSCVRIRSVTDSVDCVIDSQSARTRENAAPEDGIARSAIVEICAVTIRVL